jgi:predicted enzyme related to lactoylglutathione lyase
MKTLLTLIALLSALVCGFAFAAEEESAEPMVDGAIVHLEIPSTNFEESQAFYGSLFGWQFEPMDESYLMFETPDGISGGFVSFYEPGEGGATFYIYCTDIDAKVPQIEAAGGSVFMPKGPIPGIGWFALIRDPHGNVFGLFSAANPPAAPEGAGAQD